MEPGLLIGGVAAAVIGIVAVVVILFRTDRSTAPAPGDRSYATSTEGSKRCSNCGMGNLWTDRNCVSCGARLPD